MQNKKWNRYLFTCENETHWLKILGTQLSLSTKPIRIAVTIHKTTLGKPLKWNLFEQTRLPVNSSQVIVIPTVHGSYF